MDRYDPEKKFGNGEEGDSGMMRNQNTSGFLHQQNTMRNALSAGIALKIFNRHCRKSQDGLHQRSGNMLQG